MLKVVDLVLKEKVSNQPIVFFMKLLPQYEYLFRYKISTLKKFLTLLTIYCSGSQSMSTNKKKSNI